MGCLDENTLLAFVEARLPSEEVATVDDHLASCAGCRRLLAEYAKMTPPAAPLPSARTEPLAPASDPPADVAHLARRVAHAQAARRVGSVLSGRWRIDRLIGLGGMAQVFAATHRNGRRVAVKVLRPELAVEPAFVERFLREGYVANRVEHPGAVAVLDDDVAPDGAPFLVMELLTGKTLRQRVEAGPLPVADALRVTIEVLDVLAAAHARGIVHRDVKPENVFVTDAGPIKLLDFGIARLREAAAGVSETQSGTTMGTVGYMPPEQARGQTASVDAQSDIWAVGATLFTLLTGRVVHEAATPNEALLRAMTEPFTPARLEGLGLPPEVGALLAAALAFEKRDRTADGMRMKSAAEAALGRLGPTATLVLPAPHATRPSLPEAGSLLAVASPGTLRMAVPAPGSSSPGVSERGRPLLRLVGAAGLGVALTAAFFLRGGSTASTVAGSTPAAPPTIAQAPAVPSASPAPTPRAEASVAVAAPVEVPSSKPLAAASPPSAAPAVRAPRPAASRSVPSASASVAPVVAQPAPSLDPLGPRR